MIGDAMNRFCVLLLVIIQPACAQSKPDVVDSSQSIPDERLTGGIALSGDSALIQGTWEIVKAERDGSAMPDEIGTTVTFEGENAVLRTPSGDVSKFKVVLNVDQQPNAIDWIMELDNEAHVLHGLYEVKGDQLINCSPSAFDLPRPTSLETKKGDGRFYFELKRQKNNSKA